MSDTSRAETGQVTASAAEIYDSRFVPALFGQFGPWLVEFAGVSPGDRVLDVATGTGVAAIAAAERGASVTGLDINEGMLAVARKKSDSVNWVAGDADALPFDDGAFDRVLCQFALMFLPDRTAALRDMLRVTKSGGTVCLAVWDAPERTPGYDRLIPLIGGIAGPEAAEALTAPFILGDTDAFRAEIEATGCTIEAIQTFTGTACHTSLAGWIDTEIGGWTLSEMVSPAQSEAIKAEARDLFSHFVEADGRLAFPAPAHFLRIRR